MKQQVNETEYKYIKHKNFSNKGSTSVIQNSTIWHLPQSGKITPPTPQKNCAASSVILS